MQTKRWLVFLAALTLLFSAGYLLLGCSEEEDDNPAGPSDGSYTMNSEADCQGCHTNEEMLKATVEADDDGPPPESGEG